VTFFTTTILTQCTSLFRWRVFGKPLGFHAKIAVVIATQVAAPQREIDALAVGFIVCRIAYTLLYLGNRPSLRSMSWLLGFLCVLALFGVAAAH